MRTNFDDVGRFHEKFNLANTSYHHSGPTNPPSELMDFRVKFLQEELDEFKEGLEEGDEAKMADALIDLVYVAMGTAHFRGYRWQPLWDVVQEANMSKVRAIDNDIRSKRVPAWDVVKPEGWQPPDIISVLRRQGFSL